MADGLLTLFVDASHCHETKASGWGAWAKREGWEKGNLFSGPIKHASSASSAELRGIASALWILKDRGAFAGIKAVIVQSDSATALQALVQLPMAQQSAKEHVFSQNPLTLSESDAEVVTVVGQMMEELGCALWLRHVYGHRSGQGRYWVNEQCDRLAKQHMRALRDRLKSKRRRRKKKEGPANGTAPV